MPAPFRRSPLALAILGVLDAGPMHPYGIQRRLKDWGKHDVVNVQNRTGLYATIERLEAAGLLEAAATERDPGYPERTVYRITEAGRATAYEWISDVIATPRNEFPELPAALSFAPMLEPSQLLELLRARSRALTATLAAKEATLAAGRAAGAYPRVLLLDGELVLAHNRAELAWVTEVMAALEAGDLTWSRSELIALASSSGGPTLVPPARPASSRDRR